MSTLKVAAPISLSRRPNPLKPDPLNTQIIRSNAQSKEVAVVHAFFLNPHPSTKLVPGRNLQTNIHSTPSTLAPLAAEGSAGRPRGAVEDDAQVGARSVGREGKSRKGVDVLESRLPRSIS